MRSPMRFPLIYEQGLAHEQAGFLTWGIPPCPRNFPRSRYGMAWDDEIVAAGRINLLWGEDGRRDIDISANQYFDITATQEINQSIVGIVVWHALIGG